MKEEYIRDIQRKLCNNERLDGQEIRTIIAALRESKNCLQEPYYEVVYHDEYGKTESRIMNPVGSSCRTPVTSDYAVQEDYFELSFRRIISEEKEK